MYSTTKAALAAVLFADAASAGSVWTGGKLDGKTLYGGCRLYGLRTSTGWNQRLTSGAVTVSQTQGGDVNIDAGLKRAKRPDSTTPLLFKANFIEETTAARVNAETCVADNGVTSTTFNDVGGNATLVTFDGRRKTNGKYKVSGATVASGTANLFTDAFS